MANFKYNVALFLRSENGASAAEYALILAIVTTGIAAAAITLGNSISSAMSTAGSSLLAIGNAAFSAVTRKWWRSLQLPIEQTS